MEDAPLKEGDRIVVTGDVPVSFGSLVGRRGTVKFILGDPYESKGDVALDGIPYLIVLDLRWLRREAVEPPPPAARPMPVFLPGDRVDLTPARYINWTLGHGGRVVEARAHLDKDNEVRWRYGVDWPVVANVRVLSPRVWHDAVELKGCEHSER